MLNKRITPYSKFYVKIKKLLSHILLYKKGGINQNG